MGGGACAVRGQADVTFLFWLVCYVTVMSMNASVVSVTVCCVRAHDSHVIAARDQGLEASLIILLFLLLNIVAGLVAGTNMQHPPSSSGGWDMVSS